MKLEAARAKLTDSREKPNGELKVTTTLGIGVHWLTPRLGEFLDLYPDIRITLITTDEELDLAMREADVAIRLRQPTQPDLIQRKLFSVHFHAYASPEYLKRFGTPRTLEDLDKHRIVLLGGSTVPTYLQNRELADRGRPQRQGPAHAACSPSTTCSACCAPASAASASRCCRTIWSRRTAGLVQLFGEERRPGARRLFRLSGRAEVGRARPGVPRLPGQQRAALELLKPRSRCTAASTCLLRTVAWLTCGASHCARRSRAALFDVRCWRSVVASSQISNPVPAAVPLWKVIVGRPAPT